MLFDMENRAGARRKPLPGFIASQHHNMVAIRKVTFEEWRDFALKELDWDATFKGRNIEIFMREAYRTLANGEHLSFSPKVDLDLGFKGPGNLAKRVSKHRVLHFKDADAFLRYNEKFGQGELRGAILAEFSTSSRDIGIMNILGTNPRATMESAKAILKRDFSDRPETVDRLDRNLLRWEMDTLLGDTKAAGGATHLFGISWMPSVMSMSQGTRAGLSQAKLGGATLSAVADVAFIGAQVRYLNGGGILTPYARSFTNDKAVAFGIKGTVGQTK